MSSVSVFKSAFSKVPFTYTELEKVFEAISSGAFLSVVSKYRETKNQEYKRTIPCYAPSGIFSHRAIDGLTEYNGVMSLDIDKKDNDNIDLDGIINSLKDNRFVLAFHRSLGGEGYAVYIKTDVNQDNHSQAFEVIEKAFKDKYGIILDKACKDVSRLRFVSYDENLYFNKSADTLHIEIKKVEKRASDDSGGGDDVYLVRMINRIIESGIDITDIYSDWVKIAFGIANALGEEGRPYFHQISEASNKYEFRTAEKLYNDALKREEAGRGNVSTRRSIFKIAQDYGILNID